MRITKSGSRIAGIINKYLNVRTAELVDLTRVSLTPIATSGT